MHVLIIYQILQNNVEDWKKKLIYLNSCHYLQAQNKFEPTGCKDLTPEDVARAVVYAASQPYYVAVNEVLVQPLGLPL